MQQYPKAKRSLKDRLQQVVATIQVDVLGYEKHATANMQQYVKKLAAETAIPSEQLSLRIYRDHQHIRVGVYHKSVLKRALQLSELIEVFTGTQSNYLGLEPKVATGIDTLLQQWATRHKLSRSQVQFCMVCSDVRVWVHVYGMQGYLGELPIKTLIKKFTS